MNFFNVFIFSIEINVVNLKFFSIYDNNKEKFVDTLNEILNI